MVTWKEERREMTKGGMRILFRYLCYGNILYHMVQYNFTLKMGAFYCIETYYNEVDLKKEKGKVYFQINIPDWLEFISSCP